MTIQLVSIAEQYSATSTVTGMCENEIQAEYSELYSSSCGVEDSKTEGCLVQQT